MASLQIASTRGNFEAVQRTQATQLTNDVIYRMRTNSERLDVYAVSDLGGGTITTAPSQCTDLMTTEECLTAMANRDRWELEQAADHADTLINPRICITHDAANPGNVKVVVAWRGISESTVNSADSLDACGKTTIDTDYLKQVIINTFITTINPY